METEQLDIADFLTIETKNRNIFEEKLSILKRQSCECCFHNLFSGLKFMMNDFRN